MSSSTVTTPGSRPCAFILVNGGRRFTIEQTLADADQELAQVNWIVLPHFGYR